MSYHGSSQPHINLSGSYQDSTDKGWELPESANIINWMIPQSINIFGMQNNNHC